MTPTPGEGERRGLVQLRVGRSFPGGDYTYRVHRKSVILKSPSRAARLMTPPSGKDARLQEGGRIKVTYDSLAWQNSVSIPDRN